MNHSMPNCHQHQRWAVGRVLQMFRKTLTVVQGPSAIELVVSADSLLWGSTESFPSPLEHGINSTETQSQCIPDQTFSN